jgi:hypothetical protein
MKREDTDSDILKPHSSVRTRKLLVMAVINTGLAMYGLYGQTANVLTFEWATPLPLTENLASLQTVIAATRSDLDTSYYDEPSVAARAAIIMPLLTFYVFAWFGLGAEARKSYGDVLLKLGRLMGVTHREHWPHPTILPFSWSTIALWKSKLQQRLADALSLVRPNAPQIAPYISAVLPDDEPQVPASPIRTQPSNPIGNRIDVKRQGRVPSREPAHRLSIHKPPLAALDSVNAIPSISNVPLRRLSLHKPPFVPLAPPNAPTAATLGASGSNPPRAAVANNIRQQGESAPRPCARRLSYHKPAFVLLAPTNANNGVTSSLEPTIPLVEIPREIIRERNALIQPESIVESTVAPPPVEIPRDIIGERNVVFQAESVMEGTVAPPSLLSPTSTVPPPFSTLSTTAPAPPYQEENPFFERAP